MSPSSCRTLTSALARSLNLGGQRAALAARATTMVGRRQLHIVGSGGDQPNGRQPNVLITGKLPL